MLHKKFPSPVAMYVHKFLFNFLCKCSSQQLDGFGQSVHTCELSCHIIICAVTHGKRTYIATIGHSMALLFFQNKNCQVHTRLEYYYNNYGTSLFNTKFKVVTCIFDRVYEFLNLQALSSTLAALRCYSLWPLGLKIL